nr:hypothetical protein [Tanacetum cinerariifolium]
MLATRRYAQWRSRFLRYIDTRPNGDTLRKCILEGPYTLSTIVVPVVPATENSPAFPKHTTVETLQTMSPENKAYYESEKKVIHLILTRLGDKIYSIVDACKTAQEMWEAIERKPKKGKDSTYHTEKMLICKQAEQGVPLQAEQSDWLADTDEEIDEKELEAHYSYMVKIQEVPTADSGTDSQPLEQVQYDAGYNVFANEIQHSEQSESIRNTCVVETDDINGIPYSPDMCDNDIQNDQNATEFEKYKARNDHTVDYEKIKRSVEKPFLYEIPNDQSDPTNRLVPDREETLTLVEASRSKLNKDFVRPYDYTKLNSLYEIFKPASQGNYEQLAHANEVKKKMWRKSFVKVKPNIFKHVDFLPVSKSISKIRQAYNVMTNNINHFKAIVDQAWTQNDSLAFVHELKQEMRADLKYVESLEKEIDDLESDKA